MVVVLGAAGFIGTYLIDELAGIREEILAADIDTDIGKRYYEKIGIPYVCIDITKSEEFKRLPAKDVSAVVQLACLQPANANRLRSHPRNYVLVNIGGTVNTLDYCEKVGVPKILYTISNRNTQGLWDRLEVIDEETPRSIQWGTEYTMFSISEGAAADCVEYYARIFGMQGIVYRLPAVYGYGPHLEGYRNGEPHKTGFMTFVEKAMGGETIEVWGDANVAREVIYVKDVASAIIAGLSNSEATGLYNISSGEPITLMEEVKEIIKVFCRTNKQSPIVFKPERPNFIKGFRLDISKARKVLRWSPQYSLRDMLVDFREELELGRFKHLLEIRRSRMTSV